MNIENLKCCGNCKYKPSKFSIDTCFKYQEIPISMDCVCKYWEYDKQKHKNRYMK
jgi:hypothetical protein